MRRKNLPRLRIISEESIDMAKKIVASKPSVGAELIEGMTLVVAHRRGEIALEQV